MVFVVYFVFVRVYHGHRNFFPQPMLRVVVFRNQPHLVLYIHHNIKEEQPIQEMELKQQCRNYR